MSARRPTLFVGNHSLYGVLDVLLFSDAGAYGYVMASHYNLRGLPAEDVIEGVPGDVAAD